MDLGADIGEFLLLASKRIDLNRRMTAIEPSPDDYESLLRNIEGNKCDNVTPINDAVSDFKGKLELEFKGETFKAVYKSLQDILNEENINGINFCKMDIEGESKVIPSSTNIISDIPYLTMEIHVESQNVLIPIMERLAFRLERITKKSHIQSAMRFTLRHLSKVYISLHLLKKAGEYLGVTKTGKEINIERSDKLVVGIFINRSTQK
ncbi:MAG: FkbM family methyltransferase [Candidatus Micrarchaeaceae archaeon]